MTRRSRRFIVVGAWLAFIAVAAGAMGAHALERTLDADRLETFKLAARYQMYHALALLAVAWVGEYDRGRGPWISGVSFVIGILLFSGSLYGLAISGERWLGAVTPLGGVGFLVGWAALAISGWRIRSSEDR